MIKFTERCDRCNRLVSSQNLNRHGHSIPVYDEMVSRIDYMMIESGPGEYNPDNEKEITLCENCSMEFTKMMAAFMGEVEDGKK